jgi:hypothetical protein
MELAASIAVMGAGLLAVFIGAGIVVTLWNRGLDDSSPVLLEQMLRRQGDAAARVALACGDRNFAFALRQCTRCSRSAECRAWLTSGARDGYQAFCPNAGYVQRMKLLAS